MFHQTNNWNILIFQLPKCYITLRFMLDPVILLAFRGTILVNLAFATFLCFGVFEAIAASCCRDLESHWRVFNYDLVLFKDS